MSVIRLGLVLYEHKWILGEIEHGLPPWQPSESQEEEQSAGPIVIRRPVELIHFPMPVQGEVGGIGIMTVPQLARLPLEEALLVIEWDRIPPPWRVMEVDSERVEDELAKRYLALMHPAKGASVIVDGAAGGGKRVRLTS